mgnify:CR=1 FL=1
MIFDTKYLNDALFAFSKTLGFQPQEFFEIKSYQQTTINQQLFLPLIHGL